MILIEKIDVAIIISISFISMHHQVTCHGKKKIKQAYLHENHHVVRSYDLSNARKEGKLIN